MQQEEEGGRDVGRGVSVRPVQCLCAKHFVPSSHEELCFHHLRHASLAVGLALELTVVTMDLPGCCLVKVFLGEEANRTKEKVNEELRVHVAAKAREKEQETSCMSL